MAINMQWLAPVLSGRNCCQFPFDDKVTRILYIHVHMLCKSRQLGTTSHQWANGMKLQILGNAACYPRPRRTEWCLSRYERFLSTCPFLDLNVLHAPIFHVYDSSFDTVTGLSIHMGPIWIHSGCGSLWLCGTLYHVWVENRPRVILCFKRCIEMLFSVIIFSLVLTNVWYSRHF